MGPFEYNRPVHARFFAPDLASGDELINLSVDESRHLARVLRLRVGDRVMVFDGQGRQAEACVERIGRTVALRIGQQVPAAPEPRVHVTLGQAVLKGDAMDQVVRDATMMGVAAIQPLISGRSEIDLAVLERGRRAERWARVAVSSAKQCGRAVVPRVLAPAALSATLEQGGTSGFILVEPQAAGAPPPGARPGDRPDKATLLVGPEGGWTPEEIEASIHAGFRPLTLGHRTLRAEAAPLVALAVLQFAWGEL